MYCLTICKIKQYFPLRIRGIGDARTTELRSALAALKKVLLIYSDFAACPAFRTIQVDVSYPQGLQSWNGTICPVPLIEAAVGALHAYAQLHTHVQIHGFYLLLDKMVAIIRNNIG